MPPKNATNPSAPIFGMSSPPTGMHIRVLVLEILVSIFLNVSISGGAHAKATSE